LYRGHLSPEWQLLLLLRVLQESFLEKVAKMTAEEKDVYLNGSAEEDVNNVHSLTGDSVGDSGSDEEEPTDEAYAEGL